MKRMHPCEKLIAESSPVAAMSRAIVQAHMQGFGVKIAARETMWSRRPWPWKSCGGLLFVEVPNERGDHGSLAWH